MKGYKDSVEYVVEQAYAPDKFSVDEIAAVELLEETTPEDRYDELLEDGFYKEAAELAEEELGAFRESRARVNQWLESLYVATVGDRVNLMGELSIVATASSTVLGPETAVMTAPLLGMGGTYLCIITALGTNAVKSFRRTEDYIAEHGELDDRAARRMMQQGEFVGNCQEQGAYLAAKKHGELETFEKAQDEASHNVLPNF